MRTTTLFPRLIALAAVTVAFALGAGCRSAPKQRDMMSEALTAGEQPVAMRGESAFLDGKLTALATVSRGFDRGVKGGKSDVTSASRRRRDDVFGEVYNTGYGDSEDEQKEAIEDYYRMARAQRAAGSPMPPVTLRVAFENKTTEPLEIEITEVNSELGNFAVRPPKLKLAPGEAGKLDPMISQLGVTSDEIPLKVEVRYAGKKESKILAVKNLILPSLKK
jgi:hypothetical protein